MAPREGLGKSYAAASQPPSQSPRPPPPARSAVSPTTEQVPMRRSSSSRSQTIPPISSSNFFSSSSPNQSTSPPFDNSRPRTQRKTTGDRSTLEQEPHEDELAMVTALSAVPPAPPSPPSHRPNAWSKPLVAASKPRVVSKDEEWQTYTDENVPPPPPHSHSHASTSNSSTLAPTSPIFDENSLQPESPQVIAIEDESDPIEDEYEYRSGSAQPECGNDGQWSTPRVVATDGEAGGHAGIWLNTVTDFEVMETPKDAKYPEMGSWIDKDVPKAEEGQEVAASEEKQEGDVELNEDFSKKRHQTIRVDEIASAGPHRDLFFCRRTLSWALFAKLPSTPGPFSSSSSTGVQLWKFHHLGEHRPNLPLHESISSALFDDLAPSLPLPLVPFDPDSLRTAPHRAFPRPSARGLRSLNLSMIYSTKKNRVLFSRQDFYPTVIGKELWQNLLTARGENPGVGQSKEEAGAASLSFIWRALDDALFKGETRALPIEGKTMRKAMPWDDISCDIFLSVLGYKLVGNGTAISPPPIDHRTEQGAANRRRCLRCWLEIGLWLEDYHRRFPTSSIKRATRITLKSARPKMMETMGGDDLTRIDPSQGWTTVTSKHFAESTYDPHAKQYSHLGCTPDLSDESIIRVYDTQVDLWSDAIPDFLESLDKISKARASDKLSTKVVVERSKGFYDRSELDAAYHELRISQRNPERLTEEQINDAFQARLEQVTHPDRRKVLIESMSMIAKQRKSEFLNLIVSTVPMDSTTGGQGTDGVEMGKMDAERAYKVLEIGKEMDDETLQMVFNVRLDDCKDDKEKAKFRAALAAIANDRESAVLQGMVKTLGGDPTGTTDGWLVGPSINPNLPVGLTNIANTCYLNSLLQYFFTVREMREAVLSFTKAGNDDSTEQIRVGGRLVTKAEVERSQRFVLLLQTLYQQLIHAPTTAVTPETELAYLALVPSKEEAEAAAAKDEKPPLDDDDLIILDSPSTTKGKGKEGEDLSGAKSPSVLGKRTTEEKDEDVPMLVDDSTAATSASRPIPPGETNYVDDSDMTDAAIPPPLSRNPSSSISHGDGRTAKRGRSVDQPISPIAADKGDEAVDLSSLSSPTNPPTSTSSSSLPPPLPPRPAPPERKPTKKEELEAQVQSYMAFGRQNDVTECMDNVMFQVEAALQANAVNGNHEESGSLLKRTFYGKTRQKLVFDDPSSTSEPVRTREEPFFSLLVDVPPSSFDRDIYDGLDTVFDDAPVEIEGKSAQRSISLVELPPVLQIQLQRVQYDRVKQRIYKSNAHLKFPAQIGLDRYVEAEEETLVKVEKRKKTNDLRIELGKTRTRLAKLEQNVNRSQQLKDALEHLSTISSELGDLITPELAEDTAMEAQDLDNEITYLRQRVGQIRIEMEEIWKEDAKEDYELCAVFIHRGTASSGHYFIYQRDSRNPSRWLKYNDSLITEVDRDEIFRETTGDTNAYFLVYCRKDRLDAIESIKREIA